MVKIIKRRYLQLTKNDTVNVHLNNITITIHAIVYYLTVTCILHRTIHIIYNFTIFTTMFSPVISVTPLYT